LESLSDDLFAAGVRKLTRHGKQARASREQQMLLQVTQAAIAPASAPEENTEIEMQVEVSMLSSRAEKKWNQLDTDRNGFLEGKEVAELAEWVWSSYRPGKAISEKETEQETIKLLRRCDINGDGRIDQEEFGLYYEKTAAAMFKFHKAHPEKRKASQSTPEALQRKLKIDTNPIAATRRPAMPTKEHVLVESHITDRVQMSVMSTRAEKKWNQLDVNNNDFLEGEEIAELADWVWTSFRPGSKITQDQLEQETAKVVNRCDFNGDGKIDKEEFQAYYEQTAAAMFKFHKAHAKKAKRKDTETPATSLSPAEAEAATPGTPTNAVVSTLSVRAEKKWNQLDVNNNDFLEGEEIAELAGWVWTSFRPGESITSDTKVREMVKILERCDLNGDGKIDKEEFQAYYERTAAAMFKFHKAHTKVYLEQSPVRDRVTESPVKKRVAFDDHLAIPTGEVSYTWPKTQQQQRLGMRLTETPDGVEIFEIVNQDLTLAGLQIGMRVYSVNRATVGKLSFGRTLETIKSASRPLTVVFHAPGFNPTTAATPVPLASLSTSHSAPPRSRRHKATTTPVEAANAAAPQKISGEPPSKPGAQDVDFKSVEAEAEDPEVKAAAPQQISGFLWKKAGGSKEENTSLSLGGRNWKRRRFTLTKGILCYYDDERMPIWAGSLKTALTDSQGRVKSSTYYDGQKQRHILVINFKDRVLTVGCDTGGFATNKAASEHKVLREWISAIGDHHAWMCGREPPSEEAEEQPEARDVDLVSYTWPVPGQLGLRLSEAPEGTIITEVVKPRLADAGLQTGMVIHSINGSQVGKAPFDRMIKTLQAATRPLRVIFRRQIDTDDLPAEPSSLSPAVQPMLETPTRGLKQQFEAIVRKAIDMAPTALTTLPSEEAVYNLRQEDWLGLTSRTITKGKLKEQYQSLKRVTHDLPPPSPSWLVMTDSPELPSGTLKERFKTLLASNITREVEASPSSPLHRLLVDLGLGDAEWTSTLVAEQHWERRSARHALKVWAKYATARYYQEVVTAPAMLYHHRLVALGLGTAEWCGDVVAQVHWEQIKCQHVFVDWLNFCISKVKVVSHYGGEHERLRHLRRGVSYWVEREREHTFEMSQHEQARLFSERTALQQAIHRFRECSRRAKDHQSAIKNARVIVKLRRICRRDLHTASSNVGADLGIDHRAKLQLQRLHSRAFPL